MKWVSRVFSPSFSVAWFTLDEKESTLILVDSGVCRIGSACDDSGHHVVYTRPCVSFLFRSLISLRGVPLPTSNMTLFYLDSGFCSAVFETPRCSGYPRFQHSQALSLAEPKNLAETTSTVLSSNDEKGQTMRCVEKTARLPTRVMLWTVKDVFFDWILVTGEIQVLSSLFRRYADKKGERMTQLK